MERWAALAVWSQTPPCLLSSNWLSSNLSSNFDVPGVKLLDVSPEVALKQM